MPLDLKRTDDTPTIMGGGCPEYHKMSLSEKITRRGNITAENVKEFIKDLKYTFKSNITVVSKRLLLDTIDELAGEELTK